MSDDRSSDSGSGGGCGCFGSGFSAGGVLAFLISWKLFHAFWWAVLAMLFGWGYVFYALWFYWTQIKVIIG